MEITVANELDLVQVNPEVRAAYGAQLWELFARLRPLMSDPAWPMSRRTLG